MGAPPPSHVLSAFQVDGVTAAPVSGAWGDAVRYGRTVVSRADATSAWSGKVREKIAPVAGLRIARPVRATDGRLIVGGFKADEFSGGEALGRIDACVAAALLYDEAVAGFAPPPINTDPEGFAGGAPWVRADQRVWRGYVPMDGDVVAHLDFLACLLFDHDAEPTLTDIVPSADMRPRGFTAALVMVDGLLADAVDDAVVERWAHIPGVRGLARRALEFRKETATPRGGSNMDSIFERAARVVSE